MQTAAEDEGGCRLLQWTQGQACLISSAGFIDSKLLQRLNLQLQQKLWVLIHLRICQHWLSSYENIWLNISKSDNVDESITKTVSEVSL